jgi:hypothetical protein
MNLQTHIRNFLKFTSLIYIYQNFLGPKLNHAEFIEDGNIAAARGEIEVAISKLKGKWGDQVVNFPKVVYSMKGGKYQMEFLIDQRKTDIFGLLVTAINTILTDDTKDEHSKKLVGASKIKAFRKGEVMTLVYEFEQMGSVSIKSKGSISIVGEFTLERPSFKFILEKNYEITPMDIQVVISAYSEANKFSTYGKQRANAINNSGLNLPKNTKGENLDGVIGQPEKKSESEAEKERQIKELQEMGIMVFMPNDKQF